MVQLHTTTAITLVLGRLSDALSGFTSLQCGNLDIILQDSRPEATRFYAKFDGHGRQFRSIVWTDPYQVSGLGNQSALTTL